LRHVEQALATWKQSGKATTTGGIFCSPTIIQRSGCMPGKSIHETISPLIEGNVELPITNARRDSRENCREIV
jgi:hypothetical protein